MADSSGGQSEGPATDTDRHNEPVVDPTKNVLDLVQAAISRQDDLRQNASEHIREVLSLVSAQRKSDVLHLETVAGLRAAHDKELRKAEADRVNAIRAVDVGAVQQAAAVQATQAATLASQVATSAETLRNQVAAAATAQTIALAAALEPIIKDIADLRRAQYEAQGQKTQVVETRASGANAGLYIGIAISVMIAAITIIAFIVTLANK
jgi:hypothetical protein